MFLLLLKSLITQCNNLKIFNFKNLNNININCCYFFHDSYHEGKGSVVFCENIFSNLSINECIFHSCHCTGDCGAIFFNCNINGSNCLLNKICVNDCTAYYYQFAFLKIFKLNDNFHNFISINNCTNEYNGYYTISLNNGNISLNNYNSSNIIITHCSSFTICNSLEFSGKFNTINDNSVIDDHTISFRGGKNIFFGYSNIINNYNQLESMVIYFFSCKTNINNCNFINNVDTLFYLSDSKLYLLNCIIIHENIIYEKSSEKKNEYISQNVLLNIKNFNTHFLLHFNTFLCNKNYENNINFTKLNYFSFNFKIILNIIIIFYLVNIFENKKKKSN